MSDSDATKAQGEVAAGPNPDYKLPVPRWHHVEVLAPEGYMFGICLDAMGLLGIAVKPPGGEWPTCLPLTGVNTIEQGHKCYQVISDGRP
jgi:hypothetical protein